MKQTLSTTNARPKGKNSIDLDASVLLIGERCIGEIFGWDHVDWSAIEAQKERKFRFERRNRMQPSIHDQLSPLFDRCDPQDGDFAALKPSPIVNASLTKLVGYLGRHFGQYHLPVMDADHTNLQRSVEQERLHQGVVDRVLGRIDGDAILDRRASLLKRIAAAAESELESHFAGLVNVNIEKSLFAASALETRRTMNLREQARSRVDEALALNQAELNGLSVPSVELGEDRLVKIEMAKILLHRFPYVRNYELMLFAEIAMLQRPLMPRFARERVFHRFDHTIERAMIDRFDAAIDSFAKTLEASGSGVDFGSLAGKSIAFCGSGPLPLSALLLHLMTGAKIIMIDREQRSIEASKRLIGNLERLEIVESGALIHHQADAGMVSFQQATKGAQTPAGTIACDAVMIASLVDPGAKAKIVEQFSRDGKAPRLLILRSASGLSARLAYDSVPTESFSHRSFAYCGETLPATQIATHLDRFQAIGKGVACPASRDLLAIAHPDVINTTEVYARLAAPASQALFEDTAGHALEAWVRQIEAAEQDIRTSIG